MLDMKNKTANPAVRTPNTEACIQLPAKSGPTRAVAEASGLIATVSYLVQDRKWSFHSAKLISKGSSPQILRVWFDLPLSFRTNLCTRYPVFHKLAPRANYDTNEYEVTGQ